jgi:hypothetical protein
MLEIDKIQTIANQIVKLYREQLESKGIPASGTLGDTASVEVEIKGTRLVVNMNLEHYWRYVEYGRRSGKMPPIDNIEQWIKIKPVIPDARNGKAPSTKQLAYLIARKIGREGIPARRPLESTVYSDGFESVMNQIKSEIARQLAQTILEL